MDSADAERSAIQRQGAILGSHEQSIQFLLAQQQTLRDGQSKILETLQALQTDISTAAGSASGPAGQDSGTPAPLPQPVAVASPPTSAFRDATSPEPEPFSGDPGSCSGFLLQVDLVFGRSPRTFVADSNKISYLVGKLRNRALKWAEAYLSKNPLLTCSYEVFLGEFQKTFAHPISEGSSAQRLLDLRQGRQRVADFLIDFRTAAAETGWPDDALRGVFFRALNEGMKDQLASRDEPKSFEELASLSLRIDNRLRDRERDRNYKSQRRLPRSFPGTSPSPPPTVDSHEFVASAYVTDPEPEPMQIGRSRLTPEERERRRRAHACFYCGSLEHLIAACPKEGKGVARR